MKHIKILSGIILLILLFTLVGTSYGASNEEKIDLENFQETEIANKETNIGSLLLRYSLSVLGILILTFLGVRFFFRRFEPLNKSGNWIQILDQMPLGTNKGIFLVEIEGNGYVLGITDHQINVITIIENEERLDELRELSIIEAKKPKFNLGSLGRKKDTAFHESLQQYIDRTQNLYLGKEGEKKHEK